VTFVARGCTRVEIVISGTREADAAAAAEIVNGMRARGVMINATGPRSNILKIRPPLVFAKEHANVLLEAMHDVLSANGAR
jgi:4-aminobutyrate aminotransferase-like enzyme